ncbi:MAG: hypothetical protein KF861_22125 [Planctomycetaceae bacterium]|nr:hypothetical protein [Planctomycetaceae bacterium]
MLDALSRLNEQQLLFLGILGGLLLFTVTVLGTVIAVQVRKMRQKELELGFKDELLLRGYSVDEIIRLVATRQPRWSPDLVELEEWSNRVIRPVVREVSESAARAAKQGASGARELWRRARQQFSHFAPRAAPHVRAALLKVPTIASRAAEGAGAFYQRFVTPLH